MTVDMLKASRHATDGAASTTRSYLYGYVAEVVSSAGATELKNATGGAVLVTVAPALISNAVVMLPHPIEFRAGIYVNVAGTAMPVTVFYSGGA